MNKYKNMNNAPKSNRLNARGVLKTFDAVRRFAVPTLNPSRTNEIFNAQKLKENLQKARKDNDKKQIAKIKAKLAI